jgi:hypothetical protein
MPATIRFGIFVFQFQYNLNIQIKIYRNINLPAVSYGFENINNIEGGTQAKGAPEYGAWENIWV